MTPRSTTAPAPPRTLPSEHAGLVVAARELTDQEVRDLALSYRRWRGVLVAGIDAAGRQVNHRLRPLIDELRHALTVHEGTVPPTDLEDATMALWAYALAGSCPDSPLIDLLREPYRSFEAGRARVVPAAG